jgi:hypothetical protein
LPISFWRDHSKDPEVSVSLSSLKDRYIADGLKVSERLKMDGDVLATWLSGPFDRSRVSAESDLHLAVLIRNGKGSFYQHQISRFSEVGRRLEIAFFPIQHLQSILDTGYSRWADVFDMHKLIDIEILYEKDRVISEMRRGLAELRPRPLFVGKQIEGLREGIGLIERLLNGGRYSEAVLHARKVLMNSVMLLVLMKRGTVSSKLSHLYTELKAGFPSSWIRSFELAGALAAMGEEKAVELVSQAACLVGELFGEHGVHAIVSDCAEVPTVRNSADE